MRVLRDHLLGLLMVVVAISGAVIYGYLLFLAPEQVSILILKITAFLLVLVLLGILGWLGYVLLTTKSPGNFIESLESAGEVSEG